MFPHQLVYFSRGSSGRHCGVPCALVPEIILEQATTPLPIPQCIRYGKPEGTRHGLVSGG
jgi:hypothetical protein